jgi:hypothetical protein
MKRRLGALNDFRVGTNKSERMRGLKVQRERARLEAKNAARIDDLSTAYEYRQLADRITAEIRKIGGVS